MADNIDETKTNVSQDNEETLSENIYKLNGKVPFFTALSIGLQHVLSMFLSNVIPIIIITGIATLNGKEIPETLKTQLIQNAMFIAGVSSLLQIFGIGKIGSRLPIIMGMSFTFLPVATSRPGIDYNIIMGSILIGGLAEGFLGFSYKYWKKLISPIVTSCVVIGIGLSLLPVGARIFCGGDMSSADFGSLKNWLVASISLITCLISLNYCKSTLKALSPLFGLLMGSLASFFLGLIDYSSLTNAEYFSFPVIFPTGMPVFELGSIITFLFIYLVSATETIGDTSAICYGALNREMTEKEGVGALTCDGFTSALATMFGCSSTTSFSQNVGLVSLTKVVNRYVVGTGAMILILASFFPPLAAILKVVPQPVLGGCTILMFGQIFISGVKMLYENGLTERNITIVSVSICLSVGLSSQPEMFQHMPDIIQKIFSKNTVSIIFITALLLDLLLPKEKARQS